MLAVVAWWTDPMQLVTHHLQGLMAQMVVQAHATTVERYSPILDKWEHVCADTPISQAFMSAVVVEV